VPPDRLAACPLDRQQELPFARSAPQDNKVAITDRRRSVAPDVFELAQILAPQLFAGKIAADHPSRAEAGDDALAVGDGRGGAIGIGFVRGFLVGVESFALPEELAIGALKAEDGAATAVIESLRES
jgi:hypothetical protein